MISFYIQHQMTSNYKVDERKLNSIFNNHITPVAETEIVKLPTYYSTRRLSYLITKIKLWKNPNKDMRNHVVYQFKCDMVECKFFTYIGYTTCSLYERFKMHTQTGFIIQHLRNGHNINRVPRCQLLDQTEVIAMDRTSVAW